MERSPFFSQKKYRDNDFAIARKALGAQYLCNINYAGHFVFRDDAEDIKTHPFFRGIEWSALHLTRPPFVPPVSVNQSITKYFDDERTSSASQIIWTLQAMLATVNREMGLKRLINPKPQREDKFKRWNAAKQTVDGVAQVKASEKTKKT